MPSTAPNSVRLVSKNRKRRCRCRHPGLPAPRRKLGAQPPNASTQLPIALASALPEPQRPRLQVMDTGSASFDALVEARRNRADAWYLRKAGHIDLCNVPIPVRPAPDQ